MRPSATAAASAASSAAVPGLAAKSTAVEPNWSWPAAAYSALEAAGRPAFDS